MSSFGSGQGPVVDSREHGSELSGSIKGGIFLEWLLKKEWSINHKIVYHY
jgi:hypothetical protein